MTTTTLPPDTPAAATIIDLKYGDSIDVSNFEHLPGKGSLVAAAWFDGPSEHLVVQIGTDSYEYCGVRASTWAAFTAAESLGTFYNQALKDNYDCRAATDAVEADELVAEDIAASSFDDWYLAERAAIVGGHTRDRLAQVNETEDPSDLRILASVIASNSRQMQIIADMTEDPELHEAIVLDSKGTLAWSEAVAHKSEWAETGQQKYLDNMDASIDTALDTSNTAVGMIDAWSSANADSQPPVHQAPYTDSYLASEAIQISAYSTALLETAEQSDDHVVIFDIGGMLAGNARRLRQLADVVDENPNLAGAVSRLSGGWELWSDGVYNRSFWLEFDDDVYLEFSKDFSADAEAAVEHAISDVVASATADS